MSCMIKVSDVSATQTGLCSSYSLLNKQRSEFALDSVGLCITPASVFF
jgi:hypothetical protein